MIELRDVTSAEAGDIAAIYAHHVLNGTASYELEPPSAADTSAKIERITMRGWPFLVAYEKGQVVGYAYAEQLRDRPAYRFTCENSIYIDYRQLGEGIGRLLLDALVEDARRAGFREMIAVVGGAEPASIALHRACGFAEAGRMHNVGYKFGRWLDTVYMQRSLRSG